MSAGVGENWQRLVAGKWPRVTADVYVLVHDSTIVNVDHDDKGDEEIGND